MDDIKVGGIPIVSVLLIIVSVAIIMGLFLLLRSLFLWYWKINTIVEKQTKTINILNNILEELKKKNLQ